MDSTLLGVILGGVIAAAPSIVSSLLALYSQRQQAKRDIAFKRIELIDVPRLDALREYAYQLGAFLSESSVDYSEFSESRFTAAQARAAVFVSPATLRAMNAAYPVIMAGWNDRNQNMSAAQKLQSPEISALMRCLNAEMTLKSLNQPSKHNRHIQRLHHDRNQRQR